MKTLPKSVFLEDVARREKEKWEGIQSTLQKSVSELSELMNMTFGKVEDLEAVSIEWLNAQIEQSRKNLKSVLGAGSFIPKGISKQFDENYNDIREKAAQPVEGIVNTLVFLKEHGVSIKIDSHGRPWLNEKEVKAKVEASANYTFPDSQREAYTYLQAIVEAIVSLRKYEKEKNLERCDIGSVINSIASDGTGKNGLNLKPEKFFSLIAYGRILKPAGLDASKKIDDEESKDQ